MKKNKDKGISVNERRQYQSGSQEMNFIVQQLVKNGNTKSDAIKMTQKHYNNVLKRYKEPWFVHPIKKAEIISSLSANESVNEAGMELNKIKDAIKMFQKKIEKQGRVTNARDEEHLSNLIKLYNCFGIGIARRPPFVRNCSNSFAISCSAFICCMRTPLSSKTPSSDL